jgi:hypothetical protein
MRQFFLAVLLISLAAPAPAQDATRYSEGGITFDYPKGWKVNTEKAGGVVSITAQNGKGTQAIVQIHRTDANPKAVCSLMEKVFRKAFEGKLVPGSEKAVKRKIAGREQEGVAMDFEVAKDLAIHFEFFAFPLAAKKPVMRVVFQHGEFDADAAKKGFGLIAGSLTESAAGKKPAEVERVVELTDKASANWQLKKLETGAKVISDRAYVFSSLPDEVAGGFYVLRDSGDWTTWLPPSVVKAEKDVTVYIFLRTKALKKEDVDESQFKKLSKEGWKEVKGDVEGTFNAGEGWEWKAFKKEYKKGNLIINLKTVSINTAVIFAFK